MNRRICFFNSNQQWGGGEKWHLEMSSATAIAGNFVLLACHPGSELEERARLAGISVFPIQISNTSFLNPIKISGIRKMLKEYQIDTIIINLPSDLKAAGAAARLAGGIRVIYRRGSAIPINNTMFNRLYSKILSMKSS